MIGMLATGTRRFSGKAINILQQLTPAMLLAVAGSALAGPEYLMSEQPAPGDVDDTVESIEGAFRPTIVPGFRTLAETIRKGELKLHLRNYYLDRTRDSAPDSEAWAQGGWLGYATPWWKNRLRVAATVYTTQKLYGPSDKDGTQLLKEGQNGFTVLGEAYLEAQLWEHVSLKLYRQTLDLPYLNPHDIRMLPNTFEAYTLADTSHPKLAYGIGQIQGVKLKDASNFVSMTEAAGIQGHDRGVTAAGFRYKFSERGNVGAINAYARDYMNIFYAEANRRFRLTNDWGLLLAAQYTDQQSVGDELDGNFDTHTYGIKAESSIFGAIATLAYTSTANNAGIRSPWGGRPTYLSIIIEDFDRAGEDAWLIGLSSDFSAFGDTGFSGFINYAKGNTPDSGGNASPDQSEFDITLDYNFKRGLLDGLWIRLRSAFVNRDNNDDIRDLRAIVNYEIQVF